MVEGRAEFQKMLGGQKASSKVVGPNPMDTGAITGMFEPDRGMLVSDFKCDSFVKVVCGKDDPVGVFEKSSKPFGGNSSPFNAGFLANRLK